MKREPYVTKPRARGEIAPINYYRPGIASDPAPVTGPAAPAISGSAWAVNPAKRKRASTSLAGDVAKTAEGPTNG
jgi:hypothetical protein